MITCTFIITLENVKTGETKEYYPEIDAASYFEAWRKVTEAAIAALELESPYWTISKIEN